MLLEKLEQEEQQQEEEETKVTLLHHRHFSSSLTSSYQQSLIGQQACAVSWQPELKPLPSQSPSHRGKRQQQELITELRRRQGKDSRHVYEGKDGAIEDIITGKPAVQP